MSSMNPRPHGQRLALLSAEEARNVRDTVHELREYWTARSGQGPFYTLGAASYLDGPQGLPVYLERAYRTNPVLRETFGWLLDRLHTTLEQIVGDEIRFYDDAAVPGFHVFEYDPDFVRGSAHFDLQYAMIDWQPLGNIETLSQLSYTMPVSLPRSGGGLDTFNIFHDDLEGRPVSERAAICAVNRNPTAHDYENGVLFIHSGRQLHRIRAFRPEDTPEDERITLQGHLIRTERGWINYW